MATFTMEVRHVARVCDIRKSFMSSYPIFDESYRDTLNQKILDHYWMREIGSETIELWGFYLRRKLNEIMPVYNQLYHTTRLEFDPLANMDISSMSRGENENVAFAEQASKGHSTATSESRAIGSEYPQTMLSGSEDYATTGSDSKGSTSGDEETTGTNESKMHGRNIGDTRTKGRTQSATSLIMEYREAIINVDMMVINELEPLFMHLYNNSDFEPGEPWRTTYPYSSAINFNY